MIDKKAQFKFSSQKILVQNIIFFQMRLEKYNQNIEYIALFLLIWGHYRA